MKPESLECLGCDHVQANLAICIPKTNTYRYQVLIIIHGHVLLLMLDIQGVQK
jgi:hypothetical protein